MKSALFSANIRGAWLALCLLVVAACLTDGPAAPRALAVPATNLLTNGSFAGGIAGWTPNCKSFGGAGYAEGGGCGLFYATSAAGIQMTGFGGGNPYIGVYQTVPASAGAVLTGTTTVTSMSECGDGAVAVSVSLLDAHKNPLGASLNGDPMYGNITFAHHPYTSCSPYVYGSTATAFYQEMPGWKAGVGPQSFTVDVGALAAQHLTGIAAAQVAYVRVQLTDYADTTSPAVTFGNLSLVDAPQGPPQVSPLTLEQQRYPDGAWIPVPQPPAGVADGNMVRVGFTIRNTSQRDLTLDARIIETQSGETLPNGTSTGHVIAAGAAQSVFYSWDTNGWSWDRNSNAHSARGLQVVVTSGTTMASSTAQALKVVPKPLVLVHGLRAHADTWNEYLRGLSPFLHRVNPDWQGFAVQLRTGDPDDVWSSAATIWQNAQILSRFIENTRRSQNAWHIDVLAHSMGGLVSRDYIQELMPNVPAGRPMVNQLLMVGTPNAGSPCADQATAAGMYQPGAADVTTRYVQNVVDRTVTNRRGVPMYEVGGESSDWTCIGWDRSDTATPTDSVDTRFFRLPFNFTSHDHGDMVNSTPSNVAYGVFLGRLKPRLAVGPPASSAASSAGLLDTGANNPAPRRAAAPSGLTVAAGNAASGPAANSLPSPQLFFQQTVQVATAAGQDVILPVPAGTDLAVTIAAGSGVTATLYDPAGAIAGTTPAQPPASQLFYTVAVASPAAGTWRLSLANQSANTLSVPVTASIHGSPIALNLSVGAPGADGRVSLNATLSNTGSPLAGAAVTATLTRAGIAQQSLSLSESSAGIYSATTAPLAAGIYGIAVTAQSFGLTRMTLGTVAVAGSYALALSGTSGGSAGADPSARSYPEGSSVTVMATPAAGHVFAGWTVDGSFLTDNPLTIAMLGDRQVVANFAGSGTQPATLTTTALLSPNTDSGWTNGPVIVVLSTVDDSGGAGAALLTHQAAGAQPIASTSVVGSTAQFMVSAEGVTTVTFYASDVDGGLEPAKQIVVSIDRTPPVAVGTATSGGAPYAPGTWTNQPVTVRFHCEDNAGGSGVGSDTLGGTTVSAEGRNQSVAATGNCTDGAGNSAPQATVTGINIDLTPPIVQISGPQNGKTYVGVVPAAACSATDALSGIATPATVHTTIAPTTTKGVFQETDTCSGATDNAGNIAAPVSVTYFFTRRVSPAS